MALPVVPVLVVVSVLVLVKVPVRVPVEVTVELLNGTLVVILEVVETGADVVELREEEIDDEIWEELERLLDGDTEEETAAELELDGINGVGLTMGNTSTWATTILARRPIREKVAKGECILK